MYKPSIHTNYVYHSCIKCTDVWILWFHHDSLNNNGCQFPCKVELLGPLSITSSILKILSFTISTKHDTYNYSWNHNMQTIIPCTQSMNIYPGYCIFLIKHEDLTSPWNRLMHPPKFLKIVFFFLKIVNNMKLPQKVQHSHS